MFQKRLRQDTEEHRLATGRVARDERLASLEDENRRLRELAADEHAPVPAHQGLILVALPRASTS